MTGSASRVPDRCGNRGHHEVATRRGNQQPGLSATVPQFTAAQPGGKPSDEQPTADRGHRVAVPPR
jgi:hypothetical protein